MEPYTVTAPEEIGEMIAFLQERNITLSDLKTVFPDMKGRSGSLSADMTFKEKYAEVANDLQSIQNKLITLAALYLRDVKTVTQEQ